ncbi:hypothetical protein QU617_18775 [Pseudomonas guariconensis]|jgi:biofilm regulator BssS|uniref:hypothetical protein n=1 Tax=Pseudomonas guariconensis TaxID=1288410 RepID=UPI0025A9AB40|nr:hypothetical protein [Pseudomonas guariconensis]MDM9595335.1 hypothetical protein [Pseudomonas guariconensis]MDM9608165.1 hypothetical protein [Pseudomonas guariconensis]MDM9613122.1 hypothetical protein [Pseudomonas guariconensis]MEB3843417.1 hypothetical protein [Pseudomonas guariconensis]MEB3876285.1 hypothetical protein [Pseudomonas guariconensis]
MSEELSVSPVAGWEVQTVPAYDSLLIKLSFISTPFQRIDEAQSTPLLGLTTDQAKELIDLLQRGVAKVEAERPKSPPGPRH